MAVPGWMTTGAGVVFDRTFALAERLSRRIMGDSAVAQETARETLARLFVR